MELIKKFLNNIKKSKFEDDFDRLVSNSVPGKVEVDNISSEILQVMRKLEFPKNSKEFDEVDSYFVKIIEDFKEYYEGKREKLGKNIMKSKKLIELNQLVYSLEKNKQLLYREMFDLEEYLRFQKIILEQIKKL
jgi:hypothetical protein